MSTIDLQVGASHDESLAYWNDIASDWSFLLDYLTQIVGCQDLHNFKQGGGHRFTGVTIPRRAIITSAYLSVKANVDRTGVVVNSKITGEKGVNPPTFSTLADYQARRGTIVGGADDTHITTNSVAWDSIASWTSATWYNSPDISPVIQEIIDQAGWASGNSLVLFWDDHENRSTYAIDTARLFYSYYADASSAPKLHIEYKKPNRCQVIIIG